MEEFGNNHIAVMEKVLQKAFDVHKESIRGMSSNLVKTKSAYYKILDKCQQLQKQNEDLMLQNKKLQASLDNQQKSCRHCSKAIRGLRSSSPSVGSQGHNTLKSTDESQGHNTPKSPEKSQGRLKISPGMSSEDDCLDFGEDLDRNIEGKRKLHRKRNKRSRYSEDVSPELKRVRQSSPKLSANDEIRVENDSKRSAISSQKFLKDDEIWQDTNLDAILRKKILVPDTCSHDIVDKTDEAGIVNDCGEKNNKFGDLDLGVIDNLSVLVVPETMAMDDIGLDFDDESDDKRKFGKDLSDIPESENEYTLKVNSDPDATIEDIKDNSQLNESVQLLADVSEKDAVKNGNGSDKGQEIPLSLRSLLESPEHGCREKSSTNEVPTVLSGVENLLCENSDDDSDNDKIPCSHTFGKPKIQLRVGKKYKSSGVKNSCRNMNEVNALFETPLSKNSKRCTGELKENSVEGKSDKNFAASKLERQKQIQLSEQTEAILRRSPRKHKNSMLSSPAKTDRKCRSKLSPAKSGNLVCQNDSKRNIRESFSGEKEEMEEALAEDGDVTIAPESYYNDSTMKDNQSMDCYTVMPLKDGLVDASNQFQVKVAKDKLSKKKALDFKNKMLKASKSPNNLDETLKSPSILNEKGKVRSQNYLKVKEQRYSNDRNSTVDSSDSSVDSKSPSVVSKEKSRHREFIDSDMEIMDWMSKKVGKSLSSSQDSGSRSQLRSSSRSSQKKGKIRKSGNLYSFNFDPNDTAMKVNLQNMHQTTLTQGFFSPKQKNVGKSSMESRKSVSPDGSFKKPIFKPGNHLKTKRKASDSLVSDDQTDLTSPERCVVMNDVTEDKNNGVNIDVDLNGSLDPGAELSEWCDNPESLPSLDADLENMDPEPNDLTMENSFDCRPKKQEKNIAHVAVVRKRDERQKLQGHGCKQCVEYYKSAGRSDEEIKQHMCQCSRHRAQYVPPDTPPHFWSIGFIDTQECHNESDKKKEEEDEAADLPSYRRRRKLNKYFKAKNEMSYQEDSQEII